MKLSSHDIQDGAPIDCEFAFGKPDDQAHMQFSSNLNPHLAWSGIPEGTRSFALLCVDPDVPSEAGDVNLEGRSLPVDMPRVEFCHWAMIDIPREILEIETGACSDQVTPGGKRKPRGPLGSRQGLNDYTGFLAGDPELGGKYFGYDGPCPPWNDERLHHYVFTVFALDVPHLDLPEEFGGPEARAAIAGHVLDQASLTGTYTLNPKLLA